MNLQMHADIAYYKGTVYNIHTFIFVPSTFTETYQMTNKYYLKEIIVGTNN